MSSPACLHWHVFTGMSSLAFLHWDLFTRTTGSVPAAHSVRRQALLENCPQHASSAWAIRRVSTQPVVDPRPISVVRAATGRVSQAVADSDGAGDSAAAEIPKSVSTDVFPAPSDCSPENTSRSAGRTAGVHFDFDADFPTGILQILAAFSPRIFWRSSAVKNGMCLRIMASSSVTFGRL